MKKSDLKYGNVVELRNGNFYVLFHVYNESILIDLAGKYHFNFDIYDKDYDTSNEDREYAEELAFLRKQYQYCKSFLKERGNN